MEDLKIELERIDTRLGQYAQGSYDSIVSLAALKSLTPDQLQKDYGLPPGPAATIAAHY